MYITGYENVVYEGNNKYAAVVHLVAAQEPASMPLDGENVEGLFPSYDGADTTFLPGSDCLITATSKVKILNDSLGWDDI